MPSERRAQTQPDETAEPCIVSLQPGMSVRVLRSGRRIASTPVSKPIMSKQPRRIPQLEEPSTLHKKAARILQQVDDEEPVLFRKAERVPDELLSITKDLKDGIKSPSRVDKTDKGVLLACSPLAEHLSLAKIKPSRRYAEPEEIEQLCSDIHEVQEEVQRESQSEASQRTESSFGSHESWHESGQPPQYAPQLTIDARCPEKDTGVAIFDYLSTPNLPDDYNDTAMLGDEILDTSSMRLVTFTEAEMSDTDGEDSASESNGHEPPPKTLILESPREEARLSKSSKEDLESDREEKLDFLRLKTAGLTLEASQSAQNSPYPSPRLPASYVPRNKTAEPSYMDRKLQKMQEEDWQGQADVKIHKHRLEIIKEQAQQARRDTLGSAEKAYTRRLVKGIIDAAIQTEGKGLGEDLIVYKSKLEMAKEAAEQLAKNRSKILVQNKSNGQQAELVLMRHKSRLEREQEAFREKEARIAAAQRANPARTGQCSGRPSLGSSLTRHKSALERHTDVQPEARPKPRAVTSNATTQGYWTGLENMKVHKLGVEKAKENTKQHIAARPSAIHPPRKPLSCWNGIDLGGQRPKKSLMERNRDAWRKAEEESQRKNDI